MTRNRTGVMDTCRQQLRKRAFELRQAIRETTEKLEAARICLADFQARAVAPNATGLAPGESRLVDEWNVGSRMSRTEFGPEILDPTAVGTVVLTIATLERDLLQARAQAEERLPTIHEALEENAKQTEAAKRDASRAEYDDVLRQYDEALAPARALYSSLRLLAPAAGAALPASPF